MRVLTVGAGAIGGYFGGRLLQAGHDVTFLVRPGRAKELTSGGLRIHSPHGDVFFSSPPIVLANDLTEKFDVILLSCKSYDLIDAIQSFTPAVGPQTLIIPLLNGMKHLEMLDEKFGRERVLGGLCTIHTTLNEEREVVQLQPIQSLTFGDRGNNQPELLRSVDRLIGSGNFNGSISETIEQDMWEKWIFITPLAAATCLMRASTDLILSAPGGRDFIATLIEECKSIATAYGHEPRDQFVEQRLSLLTADGSPLTSSMFRDIQAGFRVEADNLIGDLVTRAAAKAIPVPLLRVAYTHLKAYEAQH
ncbi:2-dehydropantoate 2-reductase [Burkholderia anthina]|uniref:2-dehydropantoate 2-reductase n=1 Tax=Burkholderia anthina TaxID=179879 RepID=A0A6P2G987_9BURK|nr:2-dehydropantoate 2-reductase [Burkholderia anthina]MBM2765030.1 2-dehydropantoate 2-reductase [Burkholderia anthina]VVU50117.1 2-dehydropantoate 2-reductase [Burkholderia anthina]